MDTKTAFQTTLRLMLTNLTEQDVLPKLSDKKLNHVVNQMYDDDQFLDALNSFFEDYMTNYGDQYGI